MDSNRLPSNPFVGLRPFESHESLLFFGREQQITELLEKLYDTRFLAVVGSSGSGKSSLIRAGLIPKLKAGFMVGDRDRWDMVTIKPGATPLQNLAEAVLRLYTARPKAKVIDTFYRQIRETGVHALTDKLSPHLLKGDANFLLLVDQFEEIFRYVEQGGSEQDDAADFVDLLLKLTRQELPMYVVLTMRSDFIGECDRFHGLPEALNRSQYLVPRLTRAQRREVIEGPVRLFGKNISQQLVNRLLNDMGETDDQLPVLQHALMRTWEMHGRTKDASLGFKHYKQAGTLQRALNNHANEALNLLRTKEKNLAKIIFQALTDTDTGNRRIRRPVRLSELQAVTAATADDILKIIHVFRSEGRSFLVLSSEKAGDDPVVDISHESLIRQWDVLREWVDEEAESRRRYLKIVGAAIQEQQGEGSLWGEPELGLHLKWAEEKQPSAVWANRYHPDFELAMAFLQRSREQAEALRAEEKRRQQQELEQAQALARAESEKAEEQQRSARLFRRLAKVLVIVFLTALTFAIFGWVQRGIAVRANRSAKLANLALQRSYNDLDSTNAQLLNTYRKLDSAYARLDTALEKTKEALHTAVKAERSAYQANYKLAIAKRWAELKKQEADSLREISRKQRSQTLALVLTGGVEQFLEKEQPDSAALLAIQAYRFDKMSGGKFRNQVFRALHNAYRALKGEEPQTLGIQQDWVRAVAAAPLSEDYAAAAENGALRIWLPRTAPPVDGLHSILLRSGPPAARRLLFSPDGQWLAAAGEDTVIRLWRRGSGFQPDSLQAVDSKGGMVQDIAFHPQNSRLLAAAGADGWIRLYDCRRRLLLDSITAGETKLHALAFGRRGRFLYAGGESSLLAFQLNSDKSPKLKSAFSWPSSLRGTITTLAVSPNGRLLAAGSNAAEMQVWRFNSEEIELPPQSLALNTRHEGPINQVVFSPDGRLLASASSDQKIRIWEVDRLLAENGSAAPLVLEEHRAWVWSIAFSADSRKLISGSGDRTVKLWKIRPEELAKGLTDGLQDSRLTHSQWDQWVGPDFEYQAATADSSATPDGTP